MSSTYQQKGVKTVKVRLGDIKPNPFRGVDDIATDKSLIQEKVEALTESIESTGFWENVIGRKTKNGYEIAYGHHRIKAALMAKNHGPDYMHPLHIKPLSDDDMLIIMAEENSDDWANTLQHKRLSVLRARDRVEDALTETTSYADFKREWGDCKYMMRAITSKASYDALKDTSMEKAVHQVGVGYPCIAKYLGWGDRRVRSVWELLGLSKMQRSHAESLKTADVESGVSIIVDDFGDPVDAVSEAVLDNLEKVESDDLWDSEIVDLFTTATQVTAFRNVTVGDPDLRDKLTCSEDVWNLAVMLVEAKGVDGVIPRKVSPDVVKNWVKKHYLTAEQSKRQAARDALTARSGIRDQIMSMASDPHKGLTLFNHSYRKFVAFLRKGKLQDDASAMMCQSNIMDAAIVTVKILDDLGLLEECLRRAKVKPVVTLKAVS